MVEVRYVYNPASLTLERYGDEPADYEPDTYQLQETCIAQISACKFSYSDGTKWLASWGIDNGRFPAAIKINFRFQDEDKEREFVAGIPITPGP